ncbi:hypothetical protein KIW84_073616 [Lathyrus oleraceus]|uniref:Uncharacterized protein n=1 Tax=Pisum sativum TaxID=3888 RepID=A0A9D4VP60_PEA|nr:hypothetical protein KIW84_073616 [Pisum sativum]
MEKKSNLRRRGVEKKAIPRSAAAELAPVRANISAVRHLMEILRVYTEVLGREINMTTSEVFFSHNISRLTQDDLSRLMGVRHVLGTQTYLGSPSMIGISKKETFAFIKDHIWKRINSW